MLTKNPKVRYYTMGSNKWQSSETWPPADAKPVTIIWRSARDMQIRSMEMDA